MLAFEVERFPAEMDRVSHLNWEAAVAIRKLLIGLISDIQKREYGNKSESKLDKEEEYTLIEAIQGGGDVLRRTSQSADMNKKKTRLWNDVMKKIISIHGNNRDVKKVKKKMSSTLAFTGISWSVDLFHLPTTLPPQTEIIEASAATSVFEGPEVTVSSRPVGNREHKRSIELPNYMMSVCGDYINVLN